MSIDADPTSARSLLGATSSYDLGVTAEVLERGRELAALTAFVHSAAQGRGSVALVHGEAGIGKSTLVDALREQLPSDARLLVGHCDDLVTPRVLGPLRDLSASVGAELAHVLRGDGERDQLYGALRDELTWPGHATVLVIEDIHWVDDATLDVLRFLVRRVAELPTLILLTYRDDLPREHPLHQLLALCHSSGAATDLALGPLSPAAVRRLSATAGADAVQLHAVTGGNPFFVHEVLRVGEAAGAVPASVVESVLARLDRLDDRNRAAVEQLSVFTTPPGRALVEAVVPEGLAALVQAEEHGLLTVRPDRVSFRHELTRRAVLDALPAARRSMLNATALAALEADGTSDPALLVHHAAEAGDAAAVVRLGPPAARSASASGAHREAAAHYRVVLGHREAFTLAEQAALLQASAIECYAVGDLGRSALADQSESVVLRRDLADDAQLGIALRWLSRIAWWVGDRPLAEKAGTEAVAVLSTCDDRQQLALAHSNLSQLAMLAARSQQAVEQAELAIALGREVDDDVVLAHALNNLGTALWGIGDARGRSFLEESLDLALETGQHENAARAYCNLVWQLCAAHELDEAAIRVEEGIAHAEQTEHLVFWKYLHVEKAMINLALGHWDQAVRLATLGLDSTSPIRSSALEVIATVRVRRGEDASQMVEEAWQLASDLAELQRTGPAAALVCEHAWLRDDAESARRIGGLVHTEATRLGSHDWVAPLAFWLGRTGVWADPGESVSPYALMARGEWSEAAAAWRSRGYPYETALALVLSEDVVAKIDGLTLLDDLGAEPLARRVRRDLRERGATGVPRGPRPETRQNLAGLTGRQLEVLELLADGLTNAEIAQRLVLSVRTVDHHVTAVLEKLGVRSRAGAVGAARQQGWVREPG